MYDLEITKEILERVGNLIESKERNITEEIAKINLTCRKEHNSTLLHLAARSGSLKIAHYLLENGHSTRETDSYNNMPLHVAIHYDNIDILQLLLHKGANPHLIDKYGNTPLHIAAYIKKPNIYKILLEHGADERTTNRNNQTARELWEELMDTDQYGNRSLHRAVIGGNKEEVEKLLKKNANTNALNKRGKTPLYEAILYHQIEIFFLLLDHNIRNGIPVLNEAEYFCFAAQNGEVEIAQKFLSVKTEEKALALLNKSRALLKCAEDGKAEMIQLFLKLGADPNIADEEGNTALHIASQNGHLAAVICLLQHPGISKDAKNNNKKTALEIAGQNSRINVADEIKRIFKTCEEILNPLTPSTTVSPGAISLMSSRELSLERY